MDTLAINKINLLITNKASLTMKFIKQLILSLSLTIMTVSCGLSSASEYPVSSATKFSDEGIIHKFQSGEVLIQSQQDRNGQLVILLKSLTQDTWFNFQEITSKVRSKKTCYILKGTMQVQDNSGICKSWVDVQPLTVEINPESVDTITLTGRIVYQSAYITVLVSENETPIVP